MIIPVFIYIGCANDAPVDIRKLNLLLCKAELSTQYWVPSMYHYLRNVFCHEYTKRSPENQGSLSYYVYGIKSPGWPGNL